MKVKIFGAGPTNTEAMEQELNEFLQGVEVVEIFQNSMSYDTILPNTDGLFHRAAGMTISVFYNEKST